MGLRVQNRGEEIMEMTFVSAHLSAHEGPYYRAARNRDWRIITRRLVFTSVGENPGSGRVVRENESTPLLQGIPGPDGGTLYRGFQKLQAGETYMYGMYKPTSHLFFAGDLNYRTAEMGPKKKDVSQFPKPTSNKHDSRHPSRLLTHDELATERKKGEILHGLTEAEIHFPPTYKYETSKLKGGVQEDKGLKEWPWKKKCWPSWCDRILYLELPYWLKSSRSSIGVQAYDALPIFKCSDHRPVVLSLSIPLKAIPVPSPSEQDGMLDFRLNPPYHFTENWKERRAYARKKEIVIGWLLYVTWTWDGWVILLSINLGAFGGWIMMKSLLSRWEGL
jgi:hypothetical protein